MPAFPGKPVLSITAASPTSCSDIAGTLIMLGSRSRPLAALLGFADICALPWNVTFSELPLYR